MELQKKVGFFKKMFLAISDFRLYPFVLKTENTWKSFGYFLKLILLITLMVACYYTASVFSGIEGFINNYDEFVTDFTFQNGVLSIEEKQNFELDEDTLVIINTDYSYEEYDAMEEKNEFTRYDARLFVNNDAISYETYDGGTLIFSFDAFECTLNKTSLYNCITLLYGNLANKLIIFATIYIGTFIGYFISKFFEILVIVLLASIICAFFKIKASVRNYFKISFYVVTLPYLLEAISILCVGAIKDYTVVATTLLSYIYLFYAVRAIKLDAFLLIVNNAKNSNENVIITRVDKNGNPVKEEKTDDKKETTDGEANQKDDNNKDDGKL